jgi:hypothetical protein
MTAANRLRTIAACATVALLALAPLPAAASEASDAIIRYCGGGATGGGGGTRIEPDGSVIRLRRPRAGAPLEETRLDDRTAPYARIAAMLDAAGFERMPRGAPSNMTCSLTRRRGGRSHTVLWNITRTPAALRPAWQEIEAVTR